MHKWVNVKNVLTANCGCEIEVTNPGRAQQETSGDGSMNVGLFNERSRSNQPTGARETARLAKVSTEPPLEKLAL